MSPRPTRHSAHLLLVLSLAALAPACSDSLSARADGPSSVESQSPDGTPGGGVHVRTSIVQSGRISGRSEISGVVHAFLKATITAEASGRIIERNVERGDRVEPNQVLFRLDASRLALDLDRASATQKARETDLEHARRELGRGQKLMVQDAISEQRLDDLAYALESAENALALARVARDTARRALEDATIAAPFGGVVDDHRVDVGDFVAAGTPVLTLVELSRVRLRAGITASQAARLSVGSTASATFSALGGAARNAELRSIALVADPANGTYNVEFWLDNESSELREGMVASIRLPEPERQARPLLPREALIRRDGRMAVFVVEGSGDEALARAREVRIGDSQGDWVEILDGLHVGERAVVAGHFALGDGVPVVVEDERESAPAP